MPDEELGVVEPFKTLGPRIRVGVKALTGRMSARSETSGNWRLGLFVIWQSGKESQRHVGGFISAEKLKGRC